MSKRFSRRTLLTTTGSALTAALLAACGSSPNAPQASVPDSSGTSTADPNSQPNQQKVKPLDRLPYLQALSTTGVTICWGLKGEQTSWVEIGPTGGDLHRIEAPSSKLVKLEINDLQPNTSYDYQVGEGDTVVTSRYTFHSAPGSDATSFSFVAFGDSGEETPQQIALANQMVALKPDMVIHVGDVVYGQPAHFDKRYFNIYADLISTTTVFPAIGDNDDQNEDGVPFMTAFVLPKNRPPAGKARAYSFDYGPAHFIALDTEKDFDENSHQYSWLTQDLASTKQPWKFVYFHRPPYSTDDDRAHNHIRKSWCPLFERYGVSMVFSGHDHSYQRTKPIREFTTGPGGVVYIVTGGGGAELREVVENEQTSFAQAAYHVVQVQVHGDTATVRAVKPDGGVIDEATIDRQKV